LPARPLRASGLPRPHVSQIELPPHGGPARQLFVLLHGLGATPESLLPLGQGLQRAFPAAAVVIPAGFDAFDGGGAARQWFSVAGIDDASRPARVAAVLPRIIAFVREQQARWNVFPEATALAGFSQGAILALEAVVREDGLAGRVLAFGGRYATLPSRAPHYTTIHLFHGGDDSVMPVAHASAALEHLAGVQGDVTLDIAHGVGHVLHPVMIDLAIERLTSRVPLRSWQRALGAVVPPHREDEGQEGA
jgi:phospholipase/carboxylesterase